MFDNVLASLRIGGATVDTLLEDDTVRPGETLSTQVVVEGGNTDQEIQAITLDLMTRRERNDSRFTHEISTTHVTDEFTVGEGEQRVFEADVELPHETPVTTLDPKYDYAEVWIDTDLEIDMAIDADDTDHLNVEPTEPMQAMLDAVEMAGHTLKEVTIDDDRIMVEQETANLRVDQEIVYKPQGNPGYKELEVHFLPRADVTHVLLEFDHRRGPEHFEAIEIDHDDYGVASLRQQLEQFN